MADNSFGDQRLRDRVVQTMREGAREKDRESRAAWSSWWLHAAFLTLLVGALILAAGMARWLTRFSWSSTVEPLTVSSPQLYVSISDLARTLDPAVAPTCVGIAVGLNLGIMTSAKQYDTSAGPDRRDQSILLIVVFGAAFVATLAVISACPVCQREVRQK